MIAFSNSLLGSACRHAAEEPVRLFIFPVPDEECGNVRFVILNRLTTAEQERLGQMDLARLHDQPPSATGGKDAAMGLAITSEEVSLAYGLGERTEAVRLGHAGAALLEESFAAWFHWPRA